VAPASSSTLPIGIEPNLSEIWADIERAGRRRVLFGLRIAGVASGRPTVLSGEGPTRKGVIMGYGIGGILVLILVILAIIYLARRV
jgi:hypothetical protein